MTTEPIENDRSRLLAYLPEYKVVVCRRCEFAIQPGAFSSHLLRHQIYRSERRDLLRSLSKLKLNHPDNVRSPPPHSPPIQCFPVYSGYVCNATQCGHAFVSQKRMSLHWSEVHGEPDSHAIDARPAQLQTFFRGNKLKYFEVSPTNQVQTPTDSSENNDSIAFFPEIGGNFTSQGDKPTLKLDMVSLKYLYHYISATGPTISRGNESAYFWTNTIVEEAFKHEYLMYAILSTAAFHIASTAPASDVDKFIQAGLLYQEAGLPGFREAGAHLDGVNGTALIAFTRLTSVQRCTHGILEPQIYNTAEDPLEESPTAPIVEFFILIRGRIELTLSLQDKLPVESEFVFRGDNFKAMQRLMREQITFEGPHPFLMHAVMTQLDPGTRLIDDRDMAKLCSRAPLVNSAEEISAEWISTVIPHVSDMTILYQLAEVFQSSLMPAKFAYEQSILNRTMPPFPPRSRFANLPKEDYDRISSMVTKMRTELPPQESIALVSVMPEILALLHCYGRVRAYSNISAILSGAEIWGVTISSKFINMVEERRAVALLVTADYCRLIKELSEPFWFLYSHGDRLTANIRANLSPEACNILDSI